MKKMFLALYVALALTVVSCGAQPAAETATSAPTETSAPTASRTPTATAQPAEETSTSTPAPPIPTNSPDCTNRASFVEDVTLPDNSPISASSPFTKTWRVKNTGTCIWGPDYTLTHYSEENMGAPVASPLAVTFPDETADLSLNMIAPSATGIHRGNFVIKNPDGLIMRIDNDSRLWLIINVTGGSAGNPAPTAAAGSGSPATAGPNAACAYTSDAAKATEAVNAINAYRADNGLPPFNVNDLLNKAAAAHANDMACNNLFVHKGSDGSTPTSRVAASGYAASAVTENVYGSFPPLSGQGVVDWWKNDKTDPNHNLNLLSAKYTEIGVAYSFFNNFGYYVVVFAVPK
ncbi:MAG: hypothetical protein IT313_11155 [Anaerolineales bacterium]|nr:hypothetical protein [Anaerolineales bacterium]